MGMTTPRNLSSTDRGWDLTNNPYSGVGEPHGRKVRAPTLRPNNTKGLWSRTRWGCGFARNDH
ncbi:Uncharacterized protein FWK35_00033201 [Aphis craccivora]|uniref:Uncharacterized protein n=1 Tax=Aphis craccivora TaxID=307492 RepID=A0A6G0VUH8_APHCR|nr:Uncharacterized protein FWK35_00033201 [Aphis craccivora]